MPLIDPAYLDPVFIARAVGLVGVCIYIISFFCLCSGRLDSTRPTYFCLIFVASACVMISLLADFNLSAALIQIFYGMMSLGGIALRLYTQRKGRRSTAAAA